MWSDKERGAGACKLARGYDHDHVALAGSGVGRWPVAVLAAVAAGWMVFDGARALGAGDYVTLGGELGPWARFVDAIGVPPRSTTMKILFVGYGLGWLAALGGYLRRAPWGRPAMAAAAACSLWYLVIGTFSSVIQLALLAAGAVARRRSLRKPTPAPVLPPRDQ